VHGAIGCSLCADKQKNIYGYDTMVELKNSAQNERYVSGILDIEVKNEE
jgi:hypothetical protein